MMMNESKNIRQLKSADIAIDKQIGTIVQKQGFGKTRTGCLIMQKILKNIPIVEGTDMIVIVHSQIVKKQWIKALEEFNITANILTIQEYINKIPIHEEDTYNVVDALLTIFDEIHLYSSMERRLIVENCQSTYKIGLTATYPKYTEFAEWLTSYLPIIDEIPEHEYISNNWNVKLKELCIIVDLTPEERNKYSELTEFIKETLQIFNNDYKEIEYALKGQQYINEKGNIDNIEPFVFLQRFAAKNNWSADLDLSIDYYAAIDKIYNPNNLFERIQKYYEIIRNRLAIIYNAEEKVQATVLLLDLLTSYTTIIFSESTTMCEKVKNAINTSLGEGYCASYHSKLETYLVTNDNGKEVKFGKKRQLDSILERLSTGELRAVSVVKSFNTGIDIPILKASIILSGTRSQITQDQRNGRVTRLNDDFDTAYVINIVVKNTVDYTQYKERNKGKFIPQISLEDFIAKFK